MGRLVAKRLFQDRLAVERLLGSVLILLMVRMLGWVPRVPSTSSKLVVRLVLVARVVLILGNRLIPVDKAQII